MFTFSKERFFVVCGTVFWGFYSEVALFLIIDSSYGLNTKISALQVFITNNHFQNHSNGTPTRNKKKKKRKQPKEPIRTRSKTCNARQAREIAYLLSGFIQF